MISIAFQRASAKPLLIPVTEEYEWREFRTTYFSIIYPVEYEQLAELVILLGPNIDAEYERFSSWFETSLLTPISIRIYPTVTEFKNLNPLAHLPDEKTLHSHIGVREIVFIAENMNLLDGDWRQDGLNSLRHELAILFVQKLTERKATNGLLMGAGSYAEDPEYLFGQYGSDPMSLSSPPYWRSLWENPGMLGNPRVYLDVSSVIAFLVDIYGWPLYLEFLNHLATVESPRRAMTEIYGKDQAELQTLWKDYFPIYIEGRGETHVLYGYDLSTYIRLIQAGAYSEVASQLPDVIAYLEKIKSKDREEQAQSLLEQARSGQEATRLTYEARRALQNGEYELSILYVEQSLKIFGQLSDRRHLDELENYRAIAQEILALNQLIEEVEVNVSLSANPSEYISELLNISRRMSELGNGPGLERANRLIERIQERQNEMIRFRQYAGISIVILLLAVRLRMLRWKKPEEAQLI